MEDFAAQIGQILNNPEAMSQLQNFAASLGLGGNSPPQQQPQQTPPQTPPSPPPTSQENSGGLDVNQLAGMLNSLMGNGGNQNPQQTPAPPPVQSNAGSGGVDTNALMNMLGSLMGGGNGNGSSAPSPPPIDMNTIMMIQKAMAMFHSSNKNVELLRALRPHFGAERQKKVDDAIKIMQLINVLPLIKESGLFGFGGEH